MQLIVERRGYRLLPLIALAMATMVLVFLAGNADAAPTGPFEIDKFAIAANGDPVPCAVAECPKKSYYSGNGELDSGDGKADDWAQGASNNGLFLPSAAAPHTATPTAPCYGSNVDFNPAITYTSRFICDGFTGIAGAPENSIVSPAGDIPKDIWPIKGSNNVTPKDDLSHGYFAQLSQDCSGTPHNIVVVGMERGNNEGSNHWGIELNAVAPTGLTTVAEGLSPAANFALNFNRVVGDVFISVDLERGGTEPGILVTQVSGFEPDLDATFVAASAAGECVGQFPAATTSTNLVEQLTPPWNTPVCDPTIVDDGPNSCRIANGLGTGPVNQGSSSCTVPGQSNTKIACTTLPGRDFVEVAIDLTAYGVARGCFADVLLSTRSAPPGTSTLPAVDLSGADIKDVTAAVLPPCAISWEKRDASLGSAGSHPLQGGATFTIAPNPDACDDANTTGPDDTSPVTIVDNSAPDADADAGQFSLPDICPATYTITETVAPSGYAADTDTTRVCTVSVIAPTCVIGSALTAPPSTDDEGTRDGSGNCTDNECDFHNRLGSVEWEKRNDLGALQAGATFSISPNPYACHSPAGTNPSPISDDADGTDGPAGTGDEDGTGGQLKLDRVCIGNYTITEATPPSGFALDDDTTRPCNVTAADLFCAVGTQGTADDCPDTTPAADGDETDFCNRLGSLEWEKRSDVDGSLQAGATFSIAPNPYSCLVPAVANPSPIADDADGTDGPAGDGDEDGTGGQLKLDRVCVGSYTITEATPPAGFAKDPDDTRVCEVTAAALNCVVGTQGTQDDCPDPNDAVDTDEADFCNLVGSLYWEKRGKDASTAETGNELLRGFGFTVTGTGVNVAVTDCTVGPCAAGGDQNPDAGKFCLETMPIGVLLTIDETSGPAGYIQTVPANNGNLTSTLSSSSTCAGTPTDAGDFINQPISKFKIDFICVAFSPTGSGECATKAKITCPTPAISPTPDDATPTAFDDISETYGNGTATLLEGTYQCTIEIDP